MQKALCTSILSHATLEGYPIFAYLVGSKAVFAPTAVFVRAAIPATEISAESRDPVPTVLTCDGPRFSVSRRMQARAQSVVYMAYFDAVLTLSDEDLHHPRPINAKLYTLGPIHTHMLLKFPTTDFPSWCRGLTTTIITGLHDGALHRFLMMCPSGRRGHVCLDHLSVHPVHAPRELWRIFTLALASAPASPLSVVRPTS